MRYILQITVILGDILLLAAVVIVLYFFYQQPLVWLLVILSIRTWKKSKWLYGLTAVND